MGKPSGLMEAIISFQPGKVAAEDLGARVNIKIVKNVKSVKKINNYEVNENE
jgi:hypothetical protein